MKPSTQEWVSKAEADFAAAETLIRARRHPNYDAACFHAQQCAEKYLKARLEEANLAVPKTHNLYSLLRLVLPLEPTWTVMGTDLKILSTFAVAYRYPGLSATKADARAALKRCRSIRRIARQAFGL
jgi:HEPN domain-containing protein